MCTAAAYVNNGLYFGRNLDYEFSYGESVAIMPRNYPISFSSGYQTNNHYAIIGMAHVSNNYPLYYDAANEKGLCMAALNFVGNAVYQNEAGKKENISFFEIMPRILSSCKTVGEAKELLYKINIIKKAFGEFEVAELHWIIADKNECIVLECVKDGAFIYDNPYGVLANNPPFPIQAANLNNYMNICAAPAKNRFSEKLDLKAYSRGMGAIGLPGDLSSQSRFVRAAFVLNNSVSNKSEGENVSQFFHILSSAEQQRGCCITEDGKLEITIYSGCISADKGIYYYTTYDNRQISAVDMNKENLNANELICYPIVLKQNILNIN